MKANELRIGNIVRYNVVCTIDATDILEMDAFEKRTGMEDNLYEPEELTEEWLINYTDFIHYETGLNNYITNQIKTEVKKYKLTDDEFESEPTEFEVWFVIDPDTKRVRNVQFRVYGHDMSGANTNKESVHLLQNAYYTVTGTELKINLKTTNE